jgi:tetrahydromethanopterin S-methyltransferase subunit H
MISVFRFKREQSVVNVAGVKFGGQPGELATVLCGTIFYQGHRIVEDEESGIFKRDAAERLILRQAELSEETGCPAVLHIYARTAQAMQRYLDFVEGVWTGPFIIDSADSATRAAGARLVTELGYADRTIYNSISLATDAAEARAIADSEIDSAIILAYNPSEPGVDGAIGLLETGGKVLEKGLIPQARDLGITNMLIDPGALPLGSGAGSVLRFSVVAKARLGLPVGSGIHNAISSWQYLRKKKTTIRKCCDAAAGSLQILAAGDFLLFGPIENADFIFPVAALSDVLVAEAAADLDVSQGAGHPLHRLV